MDNSIFHEPHEIVFERKRYFYDPDLFFWVDQNGNILKPDLQKRLNDYVFDVDAIPEKEFGKSKETSQAVKLARKSFETKNPNIPPDYTQWHKITYKGKRYIFNPTAFGKGFWAEATKEGKPGKYAPTALQSILNDFCFGRKELPSLLERIKNASSVENKQQQKIAMGWLQLKIKQLQGGGGNKIPGIVRQNQLKKTHDFIGRMYFFKYNAKTKEKLPYWDAFPLIILLNVYNDGFLGINLHYLNPNLRLIYLSKLLGAYGHTNEEDLFLNISYGEIKKFNNYYIPTIKRYLSGYLQSQLMPVEPHEWQHAAYLPVDHFQKQKNTFVWKESENKIKR